MFEDIVIPSEVSSLMSDREVVRLREGIASQRQLLSNSILSGSVKAFAEQSYMLGFLHAIGYVRAQNPYWDEV